MRTLILAVSLALSAMQARGYWERVAQFTPVQPPYAFAISPDGRVLLYKYLSNYAQNNFRLVALDIHSSQTLGTVDGDFNPSTVFALATDHEPLLITSNSQLMLWNIGRPPVALPAPMEVASADGTRGVHKAGTFYQVRELLSGRLIITIEAPPWLQNVTPEYVLSGHGDTLMFAHHSYHYSSTSQYTYATQDSVWTLMSVRGGHMLGQYQAPTERYEGRPQYFYRFPQFTKPLLETDGWLLGYRYLDAGLNVVRVLTPRLYATSESGGYYGLVDISYWPDTGYESGLDMYSTTTDEWAWFSLYPMTIYENMCLLATAERGQIVIADMTTSEYPYPLDRPTSNGQLRWSPLTNPHRQPLEPGATVDFEWTMNRRKVGTAVQFELVSADEATTCALGSDWAPLGAAKTRLLIPAATVPGQYKVRARSLFAPALVADSPPFPIVNLHTAVAYWAVYE